MPRPDGRANDQLRPLVLERRANPYAEGSCLIRMGGTLVHCTASVETGVPGFKKGSGEGWVTAEYAMLPRATRRAHLARAQRARAAAPRRSSGSSAARSAPRWRRWRSASTPSASTATCSRPTAGPAPPSITGGCVALADACAWLAERTGVPSPFGQLVAAVSVGVVDGEERLDLAYLEDRDAARRFQRRHAGARALRGGAGHRRARQLLPGAARRPARPGRQGHRRAVPGPAARSSAGEAAGRHAEPRASSARSAGCSSPRASRSCSPTTWACGRARSRTRSRWPRASRATRAARPSTSPG